MSDKTGPDARIIAAAQKVFNHLAEMQMRQYLTRTEEPLLSELSNALNAAGVETRVGCGCEWCEFRVDYSQMERPEYA